jgi:orotidine-5'-phosphate decarboxylase
MELLAKKRNSNIVLALDLPQDEPPKLTRSARRALEEVHPYICAVKFNRQLVLPLGLRGEMRGLVNQAKDYGLLTIMDCKINDIGNTNRAIADCYFRAGFDAVTANPFIGWEGGLRPVFETARARQRGVILLVYMSHKGAREGYGQQVLADETREATAQYRVFARKALEWDADGAVVGATYPQIMDEVSEVLRGRVPIYSPGIGAQGGSVPDALSHGAKYLIIGRTILRSNDPPRTAERLREIARKSAVI